MRVADDIFYRCCVFSNGNTPGSAELWAEIDLSLEELLERGPGQGRNIFPPCAPECAPYGTYSASMVSLEQTNVATPD